MRRILGLWLFFSILAISGCNAERAEGNHDPDAFQVMFISNIPQSNQAAIQDYVEAIIHDKLSLDLEVVVDLHFFSYEKLTIEILNKQVDMFVVDAELDQILIDPYGLVPLDEFAQYIEDQDLISAYKRRVEGDGIEYLYALPLTPEMSFMQGLEFSQAHKLIVGIVASSPHQSIAKQVLDLWIK
ncbi:hypothetical protein [Amphibacillus sediminis]|uniref:hypothetical protein n=1 Tax=Amphibacillus sediminis TaxID=360185 RepID=UPI00082B0233|nr:hypothetical protein [Amphibacillus sediminis]